MIEFGVSAWPLIFLFVLAALLTWISYRRTEPKLFGFYKWLLPGLRGIALSILLFLLFEPAIRNFIRDTILPVQVVLVDESQSMTQHELLESLPATMGETHYFGFGGTIRPIKNLGAAMDTAPRTDLSGALEEIRNSFQDKNLRSVLLISDGQYNSGRNPIHVATDYHVPIHTFVVGDTLPRQDLMIARTVTNELAYVGQEIPVDVTLFLRGYENETVTTQLYAQDSLVSSQTMWISEGESTAYLSFIPQKEGLLQYSLTTSELENEATLANNRETITVRVLKRSQTICLIAAAPHPDLIALRNILTQDSTRQVDSYVQMQPGRFYEGTLPASLSGYDAMILVGYPGHQADETSVRIVAEAAESGVPLLFMLTSQTDLGRLNSAFSNVLPASPTTSNMLYDSAILQLTSIGLRDPILNVPDAVWERLPPLIATTGNWKVAPDSRILGQPNLRGFLLEEPLFVLRSRAGHRTAAILGSGTWRWLNLGGNPEDMPRFWPQVVENLMQWLTTPEDHRTVRVEPVQTAYDGSEPIRFRGQVYDESLNPITDAVVTIELVAPDDTIYPYTMTNAGSGRFTLQINALPEGTYSYRAEASKLNASLGTDSGVVSVGSMNIEYRTTGSDRTLLRQIAYRSGGEFFSESSIGQLPEILASDNLFAPTVQAQMFELDLRRTPLMLAIVLLLLGLEWILRKRNGLA